MRKIFIVDDDSASAASLKEALEQEGVQADLFKSGEEAVSRAYQDPPDSIVLAMVMPDSSGYEVLHQLDIHPETSRIKVLLTTENPQFHREYALIAGKRLELIKKPCLTADMLTALRALADNEGGSSDKEEASWHEGCPGVYRADAVSARFAEEFKRAARFSYPLSAIKIAISYESKKAPDMQRLMRECAALIKQSLRVIDITAITGEGEFLIIQPRMGKSSALVHAQKLRNVFQGHEFPKGIESSAVKTAMGIFYTDERSSADEAGFLRSVNEALAKARQMGENQIYMK
ncbi:MAG: response regulator [Candidatus Eremiobacteraeota bacterium]|nr:response regulator [Candidatus Eremiobacteraeota bacterium]